MAKINLQKFPHKMLNMFYLLGNEESSRKNWKRNPPKSPVPNTIIYPTTENTGLECSN